MQIVINMKKGIAVAGSVLVDKINEINSYPNVGELTKILDLSLAVGGCVPNVAIDIKKVAPDIDVYALGKIGVDAEGKYVKDVFTNNKIDINGLKEDAKNKTSFTEVMSIKGGQRTFFTYAGASSDYGIDDIDFDSLNVKMLHLGYFLLLDKIDNGDGLEILKKAKEKGITTSIDLVTENSDRYKLVLPCLPYTDNLIINETEAGRITDIEPTKENLPKICKKLSELGVKERIIIHMPELSILYHNGEILTLDSIDIPKNLIKGKTGAGDAFCAGSLIGIYNELSDKEILEVASKVAVCSLTAPDATSGLMPLEKIEELLKTF